MLLWFFQRFLSRNHLYNSQDIWNAFHSHGPSPSTPTVPALVETSGAHLPLGYQLLLHSTYGYRASLGGSYLWHFRFPLKFPSQHVTVIRNDEDNFKINNLEPIHQCLRASRCLRFYNMGKDIQFIFIIQ